MIGITFLAELGIFFLIVWGICRLFMSKEDAYARAKLISKWAIVAFFVLVVIVAILFALDVKI